jgi:ABC-type sulfate/molybdate transport systems ATPase subunit
MNEIETTNAGLHVETADSAGIENMATSVKVARALGRVWNNSHLWRIMTLLLIVAFGLQVSTTQPLKDF